MQHFLDRGVPLDPLRADVPGGNPAIGIEHEDRVVGDALDEQPEALLAAPQLLFVGASSVRSRVTLANPEKAHRGRCGSQ